MAVSMTARWDNSGTVIPAADAEYVVAEQPIAEYDNWFNYNIVADIQAVIDDVINKFNANTILKADTDNTPAALTIAEQTIIGRKTGSSIAALTATEVRTILNVENGATADQTNTEIRDAVEAATDSNTFKDADHTKLDSIEDSATTDQSNAEIRAAVEAATDSNVFTDADHTKLNGVATGAEVNLFEEVTNVLREKSAGGYDNDFVIGSPQLADDGDVTHDSRIWFDKSKGAFRVGIVTGTEWDDANVGQYSRAAGYNCTANDYYTCATGHSASAYLYGQDAQASGYFTAHGDAQHSILIARVSTTSATQSELTLHGAGADPDGRIILPANRTWGFTINIAARQTADAGTVGDSGIYKIEGGIKRDGSNNTALVGVITKTVLAEDQSAWDVTAEADDTNECLVIKVTGEASKTIHWVAKIDLVEVG